MKFVLREKGVKFARLKPTDYLKIAAIAGIATIPLLIGIYAQNL